MFTALRTLPRNDTPGQILTSALISALALFVNGFGVYLTIHANIGAGPWDVFNLGLSKTFHILYGTASITVSFTVLLIDILLREPIGISMFIDAVVVGKAVDFFNFVKVIPEPHNLPDSLCMMAVGLTVMGYTQFFYMRSSLGCGPRDTLLVGLHRRVRKIPIGAVSIGILSTATFIGWLLGGPVGVGTLICAFCSGPVMQFAFYTMGFDASRVAHQSLGQSARVLWPRKRPDTKKDA